MRMNEIWTETRGVGRGATPTREMRTSQTRPNVRPSPTPNPQSYPFGAPPVRIYRPSRSVMQAGRTNTKHWVLEFEPTGKRWVEPLMGWTASDDPFTQLRLEFATLDEAVAYAEREGLAYQVAEPQPERRVRKSYTEAILACSQTSSTSSWRETQAKGEMTCWT